MEEINYPWNLLNEIFEDTYREDKEGFGENILDDWIYRRDPMGYWGVPSEEIRKYIVERRAKKYISCMLTDEEEKLVKLRSSPWTDDAFRYQKQMSWTQIAKEMGYRGYRTAQDIYDRALRKLKSKERFLLFVPKLSETERNSLLNTVEGVWDKSWKELYEQMEVVPGWKEIMGTNTENKTGKAEADGEKPTGEAAAEGAAATE